ncbi:MAG: DUF4375 domain-containing protein [Planctomycetota bacterium]|nr:DUF4375 domain-containing protein [Planctomycetota bacterium]
MRLLREPRPAVLSVLIVIGFFGLSGCEEELPPMLDFDTKFADLLTDATDRELCKFTFYKICNRYDFYTGDSINVEVEKYAPEECMVILVWHTTDNTVNGGFRLAFSVRYNGDPDFRITEKHFEQLGLHEQKTILAEVRDAASEGELPETPKERQALMRELERTVIESFDSRFRNACEEEMVEHKLAAYIREHAAALSHLDEAK